MTRGGKGEVRIAIVGDFDRFRHSHWATEAALFHAATASKLPLEPAWIATSTLCGADVERLAEFDGVWGAPGSPFASAEGMLTAIRFARERDLPYLGTCAGFQYALIEFTRSVLGVADADSAENRPDGANVVITQIACPMPERASGVPRLAGADRVEVLPDTLLSTHVGVRDLSEEYFCSFETNDAFVPRWLAAGMRVAARGPRGEMRAFELPDRRFFVATLFQPQLSSRSDAPHPIVTAFLRASAD